MMYTEPEMTVDEDGTEYWFLNGLLHREDAPAMIESDGSQRWYLNNQLHRTDGPAVILANGTQKWFLNGVLHRTDGPAEIYADGSQYWYQNDKEYNFSEWLAALDADDKTKTLLTLKWSST